MFIGVATVTLGVFVNSFAAFAFTVFELGLGSRHRVLLRFQLLHLQRLAVMAPVLVPMDVRYGALAYVCAMSGRSRVRPRGSAPWTTERSSTCPS